MELTIQDIKEKQIPKAAFLLKETFTDDKGMRALLSEKDQANPKKLHEWFKATLKMQLQNNQLVWGAFHQKRLVGLAVASHSSFNPSFQSHISWTFAVGRSCGLKTVIRTISHDQARQKEFTKKKPVNPGVYSSGSLLP